MNLNHRTVSAGRRVRHGDEDIKHFDKILERGRLALLQPLSSLLNVFTLAVTDRFDSFYSVNTFRHFLKRIIKRRQSKQSGKLYVYHKFTLAHTLAFPSDVYALLLLLLRKECSSYR
ncbi:hypothetical protein Baya_15809 [Bagarius yarrelli]|uniref:Uncharacterized protein n=1 Tax=Bagarius yarrelli TaxID=175774 RepID=A0A556VCP2_BAGYA|nr:hypothetical protein Baya_15809 [Bagarius yarrelli]